MQIMRLARYCSPTSLDKEPYGTVWAEYIENKEPKMWVQLGIDMGTPTWTPLGDVLLNFFKVEIQKDYFIEMCLKLYVPKDDFKKNPPICDQQIGGKESNVKHETLP